MPDLSTLLSLLPDFSGWWQAVQAFAGDNLAWILVALLFAGWVLHILIIKSLVKLVFGTIWWGIKRLAYWLGYYTWKWAKKLGRVFKRVGSTAGRGVKTTGRRGKTAFKHHPWWGVGLLIVGLMFLQAVIPYNYPGRQDIDVLLSWLLGFYFFIMAFVRFMSYALHRRTGHRG